MFTASYAEDRALLVGIDEYININLPDPYSGFKLTFPKNSGTLVALLVSKATDLPKLEKALTTFKHVGAKDVQTISQRLSQHLNQNLRQTKGLLVGRLRHLVIRLSSINYY